MSYDPILNGSEATPGLWNTRFQSLWSSLETLVYSSGSTVYSAVTATRTASAWSIAAPVSLQTLTILSRHSIYNSSTGLNIDCSRGSSVILRALDTGGVIQGQVQISGGGIGQVSVISYVDATGGYYVSGQASLGARKTGWTTVPTGTPIRTTFVTSTATLGDVAQRLAALIIDLSAHGLIGP